MSAARHLSIALCCIAFSNAQTFDVASIRPHSPDDSRFRVKPPANGRFSATGASAKFLIMLAYGLEESQISGGPSWLSTATWDIEARGNSQSDGQTMLQHLLEDRFSLRHHSALDDRPAYILSIDKHGPKIHADSSAGPVNVRFSPTSIRLEHAELSRLTQLLSPAVGRPVIDRTGLTGRYTFTLEWDDATASPSAASGPVASYGTIFTAVREQLGLHLDARRAPVEVLVIDQMERPSPN